MTPDKWTNAKILNCQPTRVNRNEQVLHVTFGYIGEDGSQGVASSDIYVQDFAQLLQEQGLLHVLPPQSETMPSGSRTQRFESGRIRGKAQAA